MVTIRDVAKEARVSIGTVSRAFNGYQDINEETKVKIFEVAKDLGYAPNVNARSISSKKTNNMGLIISGFLESDRREVRFRSKKKKHAGEGVDEEVL